jgi:hypothetical protein
VSISSDRKFYDCAFSWHCKEFGAFFAFSFLLIPAASFPFCSAFEGVLLMGLWIKMIHVDSVIHDASQYKLP